MRETKAAAVWRRGLDFPSKLSCCILYTEHQLSGAQFMAGAGNAIYMQHFRAVLSKCMDNLCDALAV
jgi:hypothetical protein